tara:strand:- start:113 stop:760 length:648 start_codon:yes stop_codon:yes gene_type:complete
MTEDEITKVPKIEDGDKVKDGETVGDSSKKNEVILDEDLLEFDESSNIKNNSSYFSRLNSGLISFYDNQIKNRIQAIDIDRRKAGYGALVLVAVTAAGFGIKSCNDKRISSPGCYFASSLEKDLHEALAKKGKVGRQATLNVVIGYVNETSTHELEISAKNRRTAADSLYGLIAECSPDKKEARKFHRHVKPYLTNTGRRLYSVETRLVRKLGGK